MPDRDAVVNAAIAQTWGKEALTPKDPDAKPAPRPKPKPKEAPRAQAKPKAEVAAEEPARSEDAAEADGSAGGESPEPGSGVPEDPSGESSAEAGAESDGGGDEPEHKRLLKAGKLKEAFLKAFGRPPSAFEIDEAKWQAHRKAKDQLKKDREDAIADVRARDAEIKQARDALRAEYGEDHALRLKAKTGDVNATVDLLCKQLGHEPKALITAYVKGEKSIDRPLAKRLEAVEERLSRPAAAPAQTQPQQQGYTPEQVRDAEKRLDAQLTTDLEDHDIHRLKGYGTLVRQEMQAHYKKTKQRLDPAEAADRVLERKRKQLEDEKWLIQGDPPEPRRTPAAGPRRQLREPRPEQEFNGTRDQRVQGAIEKLFPPSRRAS